MYCHLHVCTGLLKNRRCVGYTVPLKRTYKNPSTKNPYLDKIAVGSAVTVEEQAKTQEGTEWVRVAYDGKRGYMMACFLDALEDNENPAEGQEYENAPEEEKELPVGMERSLAEVLRLIGELSERVTELEEKQS